MTDSDLAFATAAEHGALLRTGAVTSVDLVRLYLDRIERFDGALGSFITVCAERALDAARRADDELAAGKIRSPLHGIPFAIKDQMHVEGVRLTGGSRVTPDEPSRETATVVARLEAAGAVLLGTLNTHEFHFGPTREPPFGVTRNPWNPERTPGASSSGSAAAVAAGLCSFSLGGDTGGSIRGPAGFCGVAGLKPTWSRVSRHGVIPLAWSLDAVGPLARSAEDIALVMAVIGGYDPRDPTTSREPVPDYREGLGGDLTGLRIGVVTEMVDGDVVDPASLAATHAAIETLEGLGADVGEATIPLLATTRPLTAILVMGEAATHHRKWLLSRYHSYDTNTRVGLLTGAILPAGLYVQAQRMRRLVSEQVAACFGEYDILIGPTGDPAPPISALLGRNAPVPALSGRRTMAQLQAFNLAGNPAISVPSGFDGDGLPLGIQLAGRHFEEATVFRVAHAYQTRTRWHRMHPDLSSGAAEPGAPTSAREPKGPVR